MSPTKRNASGSSRPRKASTKKKRRPFKQRKIPITLHGVPLCHYGATMEHFFNGDATIQHPVVSESVASLHVTTPQDADTLYLASFFPPANSQIPVSESLDDATRVYRETGPSYVPIPFQSGPDFNSQSEDNILSATNDQLESCDFIPSSSSESTGSLSMDDWYQLEQWLDPNTHSIPQSMSYVSNHDASTTFPGNSYNDIMMYAGMAPGSSESHLTMTLTDDEITLPFPNYDANNPHNIYYM